MDSETLCRVEAARRRAAFLSLDQETLRLEVREPAVHLAKALRAKGIQAEASGEFTLAIQAPDWAAFWAQAGPLLDCGC